MATTLTTDELSRIRRELTDNVLAVGAFPYVDYRAVYTIIQQNVVGSATPATSSATPVTAAGAVTITVASATGLTGGIPVVVDTGEQRETVTVGVVSGTSVSANFRKTHAGTYSVEIESALTLVRGTLYDLATIQDQLNGARKTAGLKRVDEVEFYGRADGGSVLDELRAEQYRLRMDLARMCGLGAYLAAASGRGSRVEAY